MSARPQALQEIKKAVRDNDAGAVTRLLSEDPHLAVATGQGWTPLQDAAFQDKTESLAAMLRCGEGITAADIAHALHHAIQLPHKSRATVDLLLEKGNLSPILAAIFREDRDAAEAALRENPGLVHASDASGCPPIIRAAESGRPELVTLLLDHNADIEARGPHGQSALSACACNQIDVKQRTATLRVLLERGARADGRIYNGRTALFSAATAGWHPGPSVSVLLEHGADPNIRDDNGRTVLETVLQDASKRAQRVVRLLRERVALGCRCDTRDII